MKQSTIIIGLLVVAVAAYAIYKMQKDAPAATPSGPQVNIRVGGNGTEPPADTTTLPTSKVVENAPIA